MQQSENINELAKALSQAQSEIEGAVKDAANPFFKSRYANLESIIEATRGQLAKNGLSVSQIVDCDDEGHEFVYTQLMHASGQWIRGKMLVKTKDASPQAQGSSISYCRRYSLQSILNVPTIDDDGEAAQQSYRPKQTQPVQFKAELKPNAMPEILIPPSAPLKTSPVSVEPEPKVIPLAATAIQLNRISYLIGKTKLDPTKITDRIQKQYGKAELKALNQEEAAWLIKNLEGVK